MIIIIIIIVIPYIVSFCHVHWYYRDNFMSTLCNYCQKIIPWNYLIKNDINNSNNNNDNNSNNNGDDDNNDSNNNNNNNDNLTMHFKRRQNKQ